METLICACWCIDQSVVRYGLTDTERQLRLMEDREARLSDALKRAKDDHKYALEHTHYIRKVEASKSAEESILLCGRQYMYDRVKYSTYPISARCYDDPSPTCIDCQQTASTEPGLGSKDIF